MLYYFYVLTSSDKPDDIRYVGVTTAKLNQRLSGHRYNAHHENKRSQPVHKGMWKKYQKGFDIIMKQIDCCEKDMGEVTEKKGVKYYRDLGYNLLNVSEGGVGVITKEMRNKSGLQRSIDAHKKPVYAIDMNTLEVVKEYDSINEATKAMGLKTKSAISNVLTGKYKVCSSAGYYGAFKEQYDNGNFKLRMKNEYAHIKTGTIYQYDFSGNLIRTYRGICDTCSQIGLKSHNAQCLNRAINEKRIYKDSYGSFESSINISDYENPYKYVELDKNGNIVAQYKSGIEISKKYNISPGNVSTRIKNNKNFNGNIIKKLNL